MLNNWTNSCLFKAVANTVVHVHGIHTEFSKLSNATEDQLIAIEEELKKQLLHVQQLKVNHLHFAPIKRSKRCRMCVGLLLGLATYYIFQKMHH